MKENIIISKQIYQKYKDEILNLNIRLFDEPYFYNLADYKVPFDLDGIKPYFAYINEITLYSLTSFLDFINILLVLDFLNENKYEGIVNIKYFNIKEDNFQKANILNFNLSKKDYNAYSLLICKIKQKEKVDLKDILLPGSATYLSFYNNLINPDLFKILISDVIEEYEENINDIAISLVDIYSNIGLSKEFYLNYLEKIL